jgi:uncharacterized protein
MHIGGKYLSLTTYRRDGTAVATPVWFVEDGDHVYVTTGATSGKVKRIRHNPAVTVAACNGMGKLRGEQFAGRADFVPDAGRERVDRVLVLPIYRLAMRLKGQPVTGPEAYLTITPVS